MFPTSERIDQRKGCTRGGGKPDENKGFARARAEPRAGQIEVEEEEVGRCGVEEVGRRNVEVSVEV